MEKAGDGEEIASEDARGRGEQEEGEFMGFGSERLIMALSEKAENVSLLFAITLDGLENVALL